MGLRDLRGRDCQRLMQRVRGLFGALNDARLLASQAIRLLWDTRRRVRSTRR
jgi:hypothetical protein